MKRHKVTQHPKRGHALILCGFVHRGSVAI